MPVFTCFLGPKNGPRVTVKVEAPTKEYATTAMANATIRKTDDNRFIINIDDPLVNVIVGSEEGESKKRQPGSDPPNPASKRRITWTDAKTRALLEAIRSVDPKGNLGKGATKWRIVAELLNTSYIDRNMCKARWNSLRRSFKEYLSHQQQAGAEKEFRFEDEMRQIIGSDPDQSVEPKSLITEEGPVATTSTAENPEAGGVSTRNRGGGTIQRQTLRLLSVMVDNDQARQEADAQRLQILTEMAENNRAQNAAQTELLQQLLVEFRRFNDVMEKLANKI